LVAEMVAAHPEASRRLNEILSRSVRSRAARCKAVRGLVRSGRSRPKAAPEGSQRRRGKDATNDHVAHVHPQTETGRGASSSEHRVQSQ
jgi:hypothetical protein